MPGNSFRLFPQNENPVSILIMEIFLASGNEHKREELEQILKPHTLIIPRDRGLDFDCEETGETYLDNALLKARALYELVKMPVISDDSGLSVAALGGAPGVYSARYGMKEKGRMLSSEERNRFLLNNMSETDDRRAFFVCSMVLMMDPYRVFTVQETLEGQISREAAGSGGFGYDPVFYLQERKCSLAEVSAEEKNRISHRAKAGKAIAALIKGLHGTLTE